MSLKVTMTDDKGPFNDTHPPLVTSQAEHMRGDDEVSAALEAKDVLCTQLEARERASDDALAGHRAEVSPVFFSTHATQRNAHTNTRTPRCWARRESGQWQWQ